MVPFPWKCIKVESNIFNLEICSGNNNNQSIRYENIDLNASQMDGKTSI